MNCFSDLLRPFGIESEAETLEAWFTGAIGPALSPEDLEMTRRVAWVAKLDIQEYAGRVFIRPSIATLPATPFDPLHDPGVAFWLAMRADVCLDNRPGSVGAVARCGHAPAVRVAITGDDLDCRMSAACLAIVKAVIAAGDCC